MEIISDIEGRMRVRDERLKSAPFAEGVKRALSECEGARDVSFNVRTGSMLVLYQQTPGAKECIRDAMVERLGEDEKGSFQQHAPSYSRRRTLSFRAAGKHRRLIHYGMLISLLFSMGGAGLGAKKLHIYTGILFLNVLAAHLFGKRRFFF